MVITAENIDQKPGYKQTEVGVIPEDWEVKKLGEVGECLIGLTYQPSSVKSDGLLVLRASNIEDNGLIFTDNVFVNVEVTDKLIVRRNDILICVRNGSRNLIGKCALIDDRAKGMTFGAFMSIFRTKYAHFIFYQFQSNLIKRQIHENIGATINQITNKNLNSFQLPFPKEKKEQTAIAATLSDVDALIASLDKLIAKKRDIKLATMQQLLTGKTRLPGFSGEWKVKKLGERCEFYSGGTPSTSNSSFYGGSINWITSSDLNKGRIKEVEGRITKLGLEKSSAKMVQKGTPLLALYGATAGVAAITEFDAAINQAVLAIIPQKDNSEFLFQKLTLLKDWLIKTYTQGGQPNLSGQIVKLIEFSLPSKPEQQAIATVLSDMDVEIAALEQKRDKTRALKQGMMQELLTGKTRLL